MKELFVRRMIAVLSLACFMILGLSCVNEEYDMSGDKLNLEVTPFQKGLTIPLGNTEKVKLADLLKGVDSDILDSTGGFYAIRKSGNIGGFEEQLASITDLVKIPEIKPFEQKIRFSLSNANVSDIKIAGEKHEFPLGLPAADLDVPKFNIPSVSDGVEVSADIAHYMPKKEELSVSEIGKVERSATLITISKDDNYQSILDGFGGENDETPRSIDAYPLNEYVNLKTSFPEVNQNYTVIVNLPKDIESIDNLKLSPDAKMKITVSIDAGFINSGTIIPDVDMDFSDLCSLESGMNIIDLSNEFELNEGNHYSVTREYNIKSLAIDAPTYSLEGEYRVLTKELSVKTVEDGEIRSENLTTTAKLLHDLTDPSIDVTFAIEFVDLEIEDADLTLAKTTFDSNKSVTVSMPQVTLPDGVKDISDIKFKEKSGLTINVSATNLDNMGADLKTALQTLEITFPEELSVKGADEDNKLTFTGVDLRTGLNEFVEITGIDLVPDNGVLSFKGDVDCRAVMAASGKVKMSKLPKTPEDDVKVNVSISSSLDIADYKVTVQPDDYDLAINPIVIKQTIDKKIAEELDGRNVSVSLKNDPKISIKMNLPDNFPLTVKPKNLKVSFPEMLVLGDLSGLPVSLNPDENSISFNDEDPIPSEINLPIAKIIIAPKKGEDQNYYVGGEVTITGGITFDEDNLSKKDVEELAGKLNDVSIIADVPDFEPKELDIDSYETTIKKDVELDIMSADDVPEQLMAVGRIELKETELNLSLTPAELPDLGKATLNVELELDMPDMLEVEGADENGILRFTEQLVNGGITFDPIKIKAIDLTDSDIKEGIKGTIPVSATIKLEGASLDLTEWLEKESFDINIKAAVSNLVISTASAKVNYPLAPKEPIPPLDLSEINIGDIGLQNANLDLTHAHLLLDVTTNLGVSASATVELVPYYAGAAGMPIPIPPLTLEPAFSTEEGKEHIPVEKTSRFYVAEDDSRLIPGYEFVEVTGLLGLFQDLNNLPEKIEVKLSGGTDPDKFCYLDLNQTPTLTIDYVFELPLEFGEGFDITYSTKIESLPEVVGTVLSTGNKVMLGGKIMNALPLGLELELIFLDASGNKIDLSKKCAQTIAPCKRGGEASETILELVLGLDDVSKAVDIAALQLDFNVNSGGLTGEQVGADAYLQAILQLTLPDGITVDLKDFLNGSGNEEDGPSEINNETNNE